ncbi:MAG: sugar ABC transporter permease [Clostridiales bacterium]|jgi:multiple sugar transport system permease protein|nr:sugar ABC transporter permease [Clostridiales bacterium]
MKIKTRENIKGLSVAVPVSLYYLIFTVVPLGMLFTYAFTDYNIEKNQFGFVGFDNFARIFKVGDYFASIGVTLLIAVFVMLIGLTLGFILGYMLMKVRKGRGATRVLWYIPALVSMAVLSMIVDLMLGTEGTMNRLFAALGLKTQDWYGSKFWMYFWIILVVSWKGIGGTAILFMAGFSSVDKEIYEAAEIDGSKGAHRVFHITLPLIRPMLGFILVTGFIGAFNIFEPVMLISEGGPDGSTKVILYRIYDQAFLNGNQGFASALSVVVFFLVLILTLVNMRFTDNTMFKADLKAAKKTRGGSGIKI